MKINNTNNNINNIIHIPYQQHAPQQHQHEPPQSTNTNTTNTNTTSTTNTYEQQCRRGSLRAIQESIIVYQRAHLKQHPYGIDSYGLIDLYA